MDQSVDEIRRIAYRLAVRIRQDLESLAGELELIHPNASDVPAMTLVALNEITLNGGGQE